MDERARRQVTEDELHNRMDQMMEAQEGLQATVLTIQQQLQSVVEQLQHYNRNKSILGEGLTASMEKGSSSRVVVHNSLRHEASNVPRHEIQTQSNYGNHSALNRLEFSYFDGENARGWIRRCTRYFQLIPIPEDQKVAMASIYMQGKAELWFQGYVERRKFHTWDGFVVNVLERFGDLDRERVTTDFNRLQHETTVNAYLERFEELKDQMLIFNRNLDEDFFMMKFISGLKEEVKSFVSTCDPTSLNQAVVLARKQECTVNAILKRAHQTHKNPAPKPPFRPQTKNPPPKNLDYPKKFLTEAEVKAKREKNLCYRCDEPYVPRHRCKYKQVYMLLNDEEYKGDDKEDQTETPAI
ncbi:UNVERIFIED_CONTAM: hypothetical protein Sindi_1291800 [Sesamum indicum]